MTDRYPHGTSTGYQYGCSCAACCAAHAEYQRGWMQQAKQRGPRTHGTRNGYANYGCRCLPCTEAEAAYRRTRYQRAKQAVS